MLYNNLAKIFLRYSIIVLKAFSPIRINVCNFGCIIFGKKMFRHTGKKRTFSHNLRLASMLSFVAGVVNITGLMDLKVLTTNVTGHFAYFAEEITIGHYALALIYLLYILSFLLGAFCSNLIIEIVSRKELHNLYALPMIIEVVALVFLAGFGKSILNSHIIACTLLFSMGLQNALVTKVSNSVVRTTHLTGLFTDLGIELSQLIFHSSNKYNFKKLLQNIELRFTIIFTFFIGCIVGGLAYKTMEIKTLLIAALMLTIALFYDYVRLRLYHIKRRFKH